MKNANNNGNTAEKKDIVTDISFMVMMSALVIGFVLSVGYLIMSFI